MTQKKKFVFSQIIRKFYQLKPLVCSHVDCFGITIPETHISAQKQ